MVSTSFLEEMVYQKTYKRICENMRSRIRFCKVCGQQENLNQAPISDVICGHCNGDFEFKEINKKDVIVDAKEIIKNWNERCESNYRWLNYWR